MPRLIENQEGQEPHPTVPPKIPPLAINQAAVHALSAFMIKYEEATNMDEESIAQVSPLSGYYLSNDEHFR